MGDISIDSWFSILWTPYKSTKSNFLNTSFLTFYNFQNEKNDKNEGSQENQINQKQIYNSKNILLKGILPIKFDKEIFSKFFGKFFFLNLFF